MGYVSRCSAGSENDAKATRDPGLASIPVSSSSSFDAAAFALCFHLQLTSDVEPRRGDGEVSEFRWVSPGALPEPIHLPTRRVLAMYQEYTSTGSFQAM
ncbi:MAG TPA: hypothetical protein VF391_00570 [Dermatophilaceae bacterium]